MSNQVTSLPPSRSLTAARQKAVEIRQPMCIAVVDAGARLIAFVRMDGALLASIDIAQRKAMTAMMVKIATRDLAPLCQPGAPLFGIEVTNGGLVIFAGGIPLADPRGTSWSALSASAVARWNRTTR